MTDRRQFAKVALAGAAAAATIRTGSAKLTPIPPGVKIEANSVPASEDNFRYLKQLGVTWVSVAPQAPYDAESFIKQRELWRRTDSRYTTVAAVKARAAASTSCLR